MTVVVSGPKHRHTQKRLLTKMTVYYVVHEVNARGVRAAQKCSKIIQDKIKISFAKTLVPNMISHDIFWKV